MTHTHMDKSVQEAFAKPFQVCEATVAAEMLRMVQGEPHWRPVRVPNIAPKPVMGKGDRDRAKIIASMSRGNQTATAIAKDAFTDTRTDRQRVQAYLAAMTEAGKIERDPVVIMGRLIYRYRLTTSPDLPV